MPTINELINKVQTTGRSVRVIVGLRITFQPFSQLSASAALAQQTIIAQTRRTLEQALTARRAPILARSDEWHIPYLAVEADAAALNYLASSPQVATIYEDHLRAATNNSTSLTNMGVPGAWARGYVGTGYTVGIVDTGVDSQHEILINHVVAEYCSSTNDPGGSFGYGPIHSLCPDGSMEQIGTGAAAPAACDILGIPEECEHGTHVAGIAAGDSNFPSVADGVAPGATIIAAQVFSLFEHVCQDQYGTYYDCALTFDSDQINALDYIYSIRGSYNIAAVNMSLGGGYYNNQSVCDIDNAPIKDSIDLLRSANIATVIASGNDFADDGIGGPGCVSTAVAVGSYNDSDHKISYFSNVHPMMDLLASGELIASSIPGTPPFDYYYAYFSGTSMATPQVTGAWAVIRQAFPNASVPQILQALQQSGTSVVDNIRSHGQGCYSYFGYHISCSNRTYKLINVNAAIDALTPPPKPTLLTPVDGDLIAAGSTLSWTASPRATSYQILLDTGNPPVTILTTVTGTSYKLPTTLATNRYYWQVTANGLGGSSDPSDIHSFAITGAPARNYFTTDTPTLTWNPVTGAVRYEVQISHNLSFTDLAVPLQTVALPEPVLVTPHLDDGFYYWRVRACTSATLCGAYSLSDTFTVDIP